MTEKKKFDGSVVRVAECLVGDSTGVGLLIARNGMLKLHLLAILNLFGYRVA